MSDLFDGTDDVTQPEDVAGPGPNPQPRRFTFDRLHSLVGSITTLSLYFLTFPVRAAAGLLVLGSSGFELWAGTLVVGFVSFLVFEAIRLAIARTDEL